MSDAAASPCVSKPRAVQMRRCLDAAIALRRAACTHFLQTCPVLSILLRAPLPATQKLTDEVFSSCLKSGDYMQAKNALLALNRCVRVRGWEGGKGASAKAHASCKLPSLCCHCMAVCSAHRRLQPANRRDLFHHPRRFTRPPSMMPAG